MIETMYPVGSMSLTLAVQYCVDAVCWGLVLGLFVALTARVRG